MLRRHAISSDMSWKATIVYALPSENLLFLYFATLSNLKIKKLIRIGLNLTQDPLFQKYP